MSWCSTLVIRRHCLFSIVQIVGSNAHIFFLSLIGLFTHVLAPPMIYLRFICVIEGAPHTMIMQHVTLVGWGASLLLLFDDLKMSLVDKNFHHVGFLTNCNMWCPTNFDYVA